MKRWSTGLMSSFSRPLVATNSRAPNFIASAFLESWLENTTTSQPIFAAYWTTYQETKYKKRKGETYHDAEMTKASNTNNTNAMSRLHPMCMDSIKHCGACTHERCCISRIHAVRDVEQERVLPDRMGCKRPSVEFRHSVHMPFITIRLVTRQTLGAVTAGVMQVSEAGTIPAVSRSAPDSSIIGIRSIPTS
jgi:hypothetical protein